MVGEDMKALGLAALIVGLAISVSAIVFVSVAVGDVVNFGRLQTQSLMFQGGCAIAVAGALVAAIGAVLDRVVTGTLREAPATQGTNAAIGGAIAAAVLIGVLTYAFGGTANRPTPGMVDATLVANNADALADQMEAEADALEANQVH